MSAIRQAVNLKIPMPKIPTEQKLRSMRCGLLRAKCVYCGIRVGARPRGLCSSCYDTPEIRMQCPVDTTFGRRGSGITERTPKELETAPLPKHPTDALPGTIEKIEVMRERAARFEQLHHPLDARWATGAIDLFDNSIIEPAEDSEAAEPISILMDLAKIWAQY